MVDYLWIILNLAKRQIFVILAGYVIYLQAI